MASIFEKSYKFCPTCRTPLARTEIDDQNLLACPNCNFVFWNNPKPVVSVILARKGKILMMQRAREPLVGYWCLPGGYVQYKEMPEEAIIRETKEEAGTDIKISKLIGVYRIDNDPSSMNLDIIYSAEMSGEVSLSEEHSDYKFFAPQALPEKIAYKHRQAINDWQKTST